MDRVLNTFPTTSSNRVCWDSFVKAIEPDIIYSAWFVQNSSMRRLSSLNSLQTSNILKVVSQFTIHATASRALSANTASLFWLAEASQSQYRLSSNMAWLSSGRTNADLINNLYNNGLITSTKVKDAMIGVRSKYLFPSHCFPFPCLCIASYFSFPSTLF